MTTSVFAYAATLPADVVLLLAQAEKGHPRGAEFGKAAPIGLFVIVALLLVVLLIGFSMNKRIRMMERRQAFAEQHGLSMFDTEALDKKMEETGFSLTAGKSVMFARTEVPVTDERFLPSSGVVTGPAAIDAARRANLDVPNAGEQSSKKQDK